jgi:hypothetical protein
MNLPAKTDNYLVSDQFLSDMQECYPEIDVPRQLQLMRAWLLSNPDRRKTQRGMKRFINSWLSRAKPEPKSAPDERGFVEKHTDNSWTKGLF